MTELIIPWLFGFTLLAFIVYGLVQLRATRKAEQDHEHSQMRPPNEAERREAHGQP